MFAGIKAIFVGVLSFFIFMLASCAGAQCNQPFQALQHHGW
jgi:hypothetical protein